jgi:hypothetical protein
VKECPTADVSTPVLCRPTTKLNGDSNFRDCVYYFAGPLIPQSGLRYNTEVFAGRYCLPSLGSISAGLYTSFITTFESYFGSGAVEVVSDVIATRYILAGSIGGACVLGFVYMIFLRCCAKIIVWCSIFFILGGSGFGGYMLYSRHVALLDSDPYKTYYLIGAVLAWTFCFFAFCCICCNYSNIQIGIAIMQATAQFINGTP